MSTPISSARVPGSVTFLGVASLMFGVLGLLGSGMGLLTVLMQRSTMESSRTMGAADPDFGRVMGSMVELQERIFLPSLASHLVAGMAGAAFGAAGLLVLIRHRLAPTLVPALFGMMATAAVLDTGLSLWVQHISFEAMTQLAGAAGADAASAGPWMDSWFGAMRVFTYGCAGAWLLVKFTFATWAVMHLRSPGIVELFGGPVLLSGRGD